MRSPDDSTICGAALPPGMKESNREKTVAAVLLWTVVVPVSVVAFLRLFFLFFYYVYGMLFMAVFGSEYGGAVFSVSILTSAGFTAGVVYWIYKGYQKHVLDTLEK
jgi:hypothetical protein